MITRVRLEYFKRFGDETFEIGDNIVLAGPNNSGKTTLLQAISVWHFGFQKWLAEHAESSQAKQRIGVPVTRKDFTAIPLREMDLLWSDRSTAFSKGEKEGVKPGRPKLVSVTVWGKNPNSSTEWCLGVSFRYTSKEQVYVKLIDEKGQPTTDVPEEVRQIDVVHVPPFSGIGAEETGLNPGYQNMLVGQGKPGDILRNLLLDVHKKGKDWETMLEVVKELFGYELKEPQYAEAAVPFIRIEYCEKKNPQVKLDLASAGSGFHQVLMLFAFFYARSASILLLDEPDAHLHVILQRQVYDKLKTIAREKNCQLIISTHSEILLEDTDPDQILSFYGRPHPLQIDTQRDQVREALKRLTSLDIIAAESGKNVLYVEDESDFKILKEFAKKLSPGMTIFFDDPFFCSIHGRDAREAKAHFWGLKAIRPTIKGVLLLDGDDRKLQDREVGAELLDILRWNRYEIENYLLVPSVLYRFIKGKQPDFDLFSRRQKEAGEKYLKDNLPPAVFANPLQDHDFLDSTSISKTILPGFFKNAETSLHKKDYFQIASLMDAAEIHPEVKHKLDAMEKILLGK